MSLLKLKKKPQTGNDNILSMTLYCMFVYNHIWGFPGGSVGEESSCNARDLSLIPGSERSTGEGIGYPLQYSGLENHRTE